MKEQQIALQGGRSAVSGVKICMYYSSLQCVQ